MKDISYKKPLAISLITYMGLSILFAILFWIPVGNESTLYTVKGYLLPASYIIKMAIVLYIAFAPNCKSKVKAKVGACMFSLLMLVYVVSQVLHLLQCGWNIPSTWVSNLCLSLLFECFGLLLLFWGSRAWLPVKITASFYIFITAIMRIVWAIINCMAQSGEGWSYSRFETYFNINNVLTYVNLFVLANALILTIIWMATGNRRQNDTATASKD